MSLGSPYAGGIEKYKIADYGGLSVPIWGRHEILRFNLSLWYLRPYDVGMHFTRISLNMQVAHVAQFLSRIIADQVCEST
jgi:hypothetical protein